MRLLKSEYYIIDANFIVYATFSTVKAHYLRHYLVTDEL